MAPRGGWLVALLVVTSAFSAAGVEPKRRPSRMDARKWTRDAKKKAVSAAKSFLEESGQSLLVPVDVEVFLIGFDGAGGYAHRQDANKLLSLLLSGAGHHCPHSLEGGGELGVCFQVQYQVLGADELGDEALRLLRHIEAYIKAHASDPLQTQPWLRPRGRGMPDPNNPDSRFEPEYVVDAAGLEPLFDAFLEAAYGGAGGAEHGHNWHQHNPIFVINPSKVRANPQGTPNDEGHVVPDFLQQWASHTYRPEDLAKEEAGYVYRYSYNGVGEATAWTSSRNYVVIDVAAGPTSFGPVASASGTVTPSTMPALRDVYRAIFDDLKEVGQTLTAQEHAQVVASHAQKALFEGALASTIGGAVRSLFIPDIATEQLESARHILIPVVLLTDYELTEEDYEKNVQQENFMHINLTRVERSVGRLIDEGQEAVVVSAHHPLSRHKALMAAFWKARRSKSEQAADVRGATGGRMGHHTVTHTSVDPDLLMEELALAADSLTHGLVAAAHAMSKDQAHPLEQLRHDGTRVVPVFVFSLMNAPEDIVFANREMVAASHDAVLVLQLRQSAQWGGTRDEHFTGHLTNGVRVNADSRDVTRHVIAGLAQALAGVVPPYARPRPPGPAPPGPAASDWRWAVGATPFGPYSNFTGVSEITQNAARRNLLIAHVSAALREPQRRLDGLDAFVEEHFRAPFAAAGVGDGKREGRRHFLDTVASTRHGFKTGLTEDVVARLEGGMAEVAGGLEDLAVDLYSHDFAAADAAIREKLLPSAARLCAGLDGAVAEAKQVIACCRARHVSALGRLVRMAIGAAAAFTVVFVLGITVAVVSGRRRRSSGGGLALPTTYGGGGLLGGGGGLLGGGGGGGGAYGYRPSSRQQGWQL